MNKKKTKEDLENILNLISNLDYNKAYNNLLENFMLRMNESNDIDDYIMYLSDKMLEFAREDKNKKDLFLKSNRALRSIAHKIYRGYNDDREKENFLTLVR